MKLLVTINKKEDLLNLDKSLVSGIIIGIDGLTVNTNFSLSKEEVIPLLKDYKVVYLLINKIMHNKDLLYLEEIIDSFKEENIKFIFYDLAVLEIAKKLGIENKFIISEDHLNNSIMSNKFFSSQKLDGAILSNDITLDEIVEIKKSVSYKIYVLAYGYVPIFNSGRKLISSYLDYIKEDKEDGTYYLKYNEKEYPVMEKDDMTVVYDYEKIDYSSEYDIFKENNIDYLILNTIYEDGNINDVIRNFTLKINKNNYKGFLYTKTIYRVKKDEK